MTVFLAQFLAMLLLLWTRIYNHRINYIYASYLVCTSLIKLISSVYCCSSAGASSPPVPANAGSTDWLGQGQGSKGGSLSRIGSQPLWTSLSTSAGGSALGTLQPSCRPWERGDLLRRLSTFKPENWFGKPKVLICLSMISSLMHP